MNNRNHFIFIFTFYLYRPFAFFYIFFFSSIFSQISYQKKKKKNAQCFRLVMDFSKFVDFQLFSLLSSFQFPTFQNCRLILGFSNEPLIFRRAIYIISRCSILIDKFKKFLLYFILSHIFKYNYTFYHVLLYIFLISNLGITSIDPSQSDISSNFTACQSS